MSADRSVQVGIALLSLGAAVVVARLGYIWSVSSSHFWNLWALVGVVVGGVGLAVMVVSWVMPSKESSPSQVQTGGHGSTNLQAGRDITIRPEDLGK